MILPGLVRRRRSGLIKVPIRDQTCGSDEACVYDEVHRAGCAARLFARRPILRRAARGIRIALGKGSPGTIRRHRPVVVHIVADFIDEAPAVVAQLKRAAVVVEPAGERPKHSGQSRARHQRRWRDGHDKVAAPANDRVRGERVINRAADGPVGHVDVHREQVAQLHPFHRGLVGCGMIHDFIESHGCVRADLLHGTDGEEGEGEQYLFHIHHQVEPVRIPNGTDARY